MASGSSEAVAMGAGGGAIACACKVQQGQWSVMAPTGAVGSLCVASGASCARLKTADEQISAPPPLPPDISTNA